MCVCEKCEYAFSVSTRRCLVRAQAWYFEVQLTGVMYGDVSSIVALLPRCAAPSMVASASPRCCVCFVVVRVGRRRKGGLIRRKARRGTKRQEGGRVEFGKASSHFPVPSSQFAVRHPSFSSFALRPSPFALRPWLFRVSRHHMSLVSSEAPFPSLPSGVSCPSLVPSPTYDTGGPTHNGCTHGLPLS